MASYSSRILKDIDRWSADGLIDQQIAHLLRRDVEANRREALSFGFILAIMAAVLFGAAILLFIAANWEVFPRLARVIMLGTLIGGGNVGGAWLKERGHRAAAEGLWLVAAAAFGASIALIGQMYHLSGDEADAVLIWCAAVAVAATGLRSAPLTIAAVALADAWLLMRGMEGWGGAGFPYLFPAIAAAFWLVSLWTECRPARHLLVLSLLAYVFLLAIRHDFLTVAALLASISAALFAASVRWPDLSERWVRLNGKLPLHSFQGFLLGMIMTQSWLAADDAPFVLVAALTLAGIAAALLLAGREDRRLRTVAYLAFGIELCFIYVVTMSTMLGTAGFFLAAGAILGLLAIFIIRMERRLKSQGAGAELAA